MAILNVETRLGSLLAICDELSVLGRPVPKNELVKRCMAGIERDPNGRTVGTINSFNNVDKGVGLFEENKQDNDKIWFAKKYEKLAKLDNEGRRLELPVILRNLLFNGDATDNFMTDNTGMNDVNRIFAWLLAQDPYNTSLENKALFDLENEQLGSVETRVLNSNSSRMPNVRNWGHYLGFLTPISDDYMIDPTRAIQASLDDIFGDKVEIEGPKFLKSLAKKIPIIDEGAYRVKVEETLLNTAVWEQPSEGFLSKSLSLALWRLDINPKINFDLEHRADARGIKKLSPPPGQSEKAFSHVVRNKDD